MRLFFGKGQIMPWVQMLASAITLTVLNLGWSGVHSTSTSWPNGVKAALETATSLFNGKTLEDWRVTDFTGHGGVEVQDGVLVLQEGNPLTGITWTGHFPKNDFIVTLEAMRVRGEDFFCGLTFPVDQSHCSLIIGGWGGTIVGLSSIDGYDASENQTTRKMYFNHGQWYRIQLEVTRKRIRAWIDDRLVVDLAASNRTFSVRPDIWLSRPFGVASWHTEAAFRNLRLIRLDSGNRGGGR